MAIPTFSTQTLTQTTGSIPVGMGLQVLFQLVGVTAGSIAMLFPVGFDPRIHIRYSMAVVDANLQAMFEFVHDGLVPIALPASFKFLVISGV